MFSAQRIALLKKILSEQKSVDIATLCSHLEVSDVTVRKYLDQLEQEGFLIKLHGGAMLAGTETGADEEAYSQSMSIPHMKEKEHIAEIAATLVEDGDNIFLGSGTTCMFLAKKLYQKHNITVLTNNINALSYLSPYVKKLCILGGDVAGSNGLMYTYGTPVMSQLERIYVSKAFFGAGGVDLNAGVTVNDMDVSLIMEKVSTVSAKRIILADSSKFNRIDLYRVNVLDQFDIYVTDSKLDNKYKSYFFDHDIKLITSFDI